MICRGANAALLHCCSTLRPCQWVLVGMGGGSGMLMLSIYHLLPCCPAALQTKHVECAEALLGPGPELNAFMIRLLEDMGNLKAMLQAISIGEWSAGQSRQAGHVIRCAALRCTAQ